MDMSLHPLRLPHGLDIIPRSRACTIQVLTRTAYNQNEALTNIYARDPFWTAPNRWVFRKLYRDAYFWPTPDHWKKMRNR